MKLKIYRILLFLLCATGLAACDLTDSDIRLVLRTIAEYEEAGGGVPFSSVVNDDLLKNNSPSGALLVSRTSLAERGEQWTVNVNGVEKTFIVTFGKAPGGRFRRPDGFGVRYRDLPEALDTQTTDAISEAEIRRRVDNPIVRRAFIPYARKEFSFSKEFGMVMSKAFAVSDDGAWGIGVSGYQNYARHKALENCDKLRMASGSKCKLINVDGRWTR